MFARGMTPQEVAVELITRWDAREAALAARDGVGRFLDDLAALGRGA